MGPAAAPVVSLLPLLAQRPCHSLALRLNGFAKSRSACISRVAQHRPDLGTLPPSLAKAGGDSLLIESAGDRPDAQALLGVPAEHLSHDLRLDFIDQITGVGRWGLFDIVITIGGSAEHIDRTALSSVTLASSTALGDLRSLVLSDHALKLDQQLFFWGLR